MSQGSTGSSLIAAALILGASLVAGGYFVSVSIDGATLQLASLNTSMAIIANNSGSGAAPSAAARPAAPQVYEIEVGSAPIQGGGTEAKVTIIEWADFQCPYCGRVGPTLEQVKDEYGDDVRIVFKHLPLSFHDKANGAHQAAEAAHQQGQFWEMHDLIFANQRTLSEENYLRYAVEIGLDLKQFKADMASPKVQNRINEDLKVAQSLGVTGTPTFIINGKKLSGAQPFPAFKNMIDAELAKL
jgi:protein-disulfide isomerase